MSRVFLLGGKRGGGRILVGGAKCGDVCCAVMCVVVLWGCTRRARWFYVVRKGWSIG